MLKLLHITQNLLAFLSTLGMFQKIRDVRTVTRTLTVSQGSSTVVNLMTSKKNVTQICPSFSLDHLHFLFHWAVLKAHINKTDQNAQSIQNFCQLCPLLSQKICNVQLNFKHK